MGFNLDDIKENLSNGLSNIKNSLSDLQKNFLESKVFSAVNGALDIGIRFALPDCIEDEVISIKDTLLKNGLIEGVKATVKTATDFGKNCVSIATNNFKTVDELESAVKTRGTLDTISEFFDKAVDNAKSAGFISKSTKTKLKSTKKTFIKNVDTNLTSELKQQKSYIKQINEYATKWQKYFNSENLEKMTEVYNEMKNYVETTTVCPFKDNLEKYNEIEMLQSVVTNNGGNFNLSEDELNLVKALSS
jgi:vacuolar-type H+-ATPase catalytic subunit A/Vma1